jgi:hypothetical protein
VIAELEVRPGPIGQAIEVGFQSIANLFDNFKLLNISNNRIKTILKTKT